jgi:hypothetical protein
MPHRKGIDLCDKRICTSQRTKFRIRDGARNEQRADVKRSARVRRGSIVIIASDTSRFATNCMRLQKPAWDKGFCYARRVCPWPARRSRARSSEARRRDFAARQIVNYVVEKVCRAKAGRLRESSALVRISTSDSLSDSPGEQFERPRRSLFAPVEGRRDDRGRSQPELLLQTIVDRLRVGLAAARLHHLPDEPADQRRLRLRLGDLVGIGGDDRGDDSVDGGEIGDLT